MHILFQNGSLYKISTSNENYDYESVWVKFDIRLYEDLDLVRWSALTVTLIQNSGHI